MNHHRKLSLLLCAAVIGLPACAGPPHPDQKARAIDPVAAVDTADPVADPWAAAKAANSRGTYVQYLEAHPDSPHAQEASLRIQELDWATALASNSLASYQHYLAQHPDGRRAAQARESIDSIRLDLAALSITSVRIRVHQNPEPFFGSIQFASDLGLNANEPMVVDVDLRPPPQDHHYVILTLGVNPAASFDLPFALTGARAQKLAPHAKSLQSGKATWLETSRTRFKLEQGKAGAFECLWILSGQDLEQGSLDLGGRTYRIVEYR